MNVRAKHGPALSCTPPVRDGAPNPGTCPGQEQNRQSFDAQADCQQTGRMILLGGVFSQYFFQKNSNGKCFPLLGNEKGPLPPPSLPSV